MSATFARPLWRPDISPATVIVNAAPNGFADSVTLDPATLRAAGALVQGQLHAVVADASGDHRLWLQNGTGAVQAAVLIPLDDHFDQRVQNAQRLYRRLNGRPTGPQPLWQRLSTYQLHRIALMLRAWDGTESGASRREVASVLLNRDVMMLRAIDWKNAPERRRLNRLLTTTRELINGGYLRLLRGDPLHVHLFRSR